MSEKGRYIISFQKGGRGKGVQKKRHDCRLLKSKRPQGDVIDRKLQLRLEKKSAYLNFLEFFGTYLHILYIYLCICNMYFSDIYMYTHTNIHILFLYAAYTWFNVGYSFHYICFDFSSYEKIWRRGQCEKIRTRTFIVPFK